jgi:hypothetical protein
MERRAAKHEDRQVKCLIASRGHLWMRDYFDRLPLAVRRRLANSRHNICPACLVGEAAGVAATRGLRRPTIVAEPGLRRPTIANYLSVIEAIERKLDDV